MSYNDWLDIEVLEDYLDGKLDAKAMHQVEKLSLEDPFVSDALEGLSKSPKRTQSLSILQKQLRDRVAQKPVEKKMWAVTSVRLSIASAAAVLFIAVSVLFWLKGNKRQDILATNNANKTNEVSVGAVNAYEGANSDKATVVENGVVDKNIITQKVTPLNTKKSNQTSDLPIASTVTNPSVARVSTPVVVVEEKASIAMVDSSALIMGRAERKESAMTAQKVQADRSGKALAEVSIINSSANTPIGGWDNYKIYIKENKQSTNAITISVKLLFEINKDGSIKNVKVLNDVGVDLQNEAIRLLKEGPKWTYLNAQSNLAEIEIKL